ncbi:disulfide bond formation protein DsbB [Photobacterium profundum]|uniref:Disulfide bond formation protein B n=1 Tax=Photobacterium profundum 3TCK TaxID=314280 RepID=Q1Z7X4_9GAMM|nr:disulfide bond formation protein DsbB [Photobacterium profundum]EAS44739.1 disulfide bond formation protein B [Photobacterium profundum 3TCK]PSV60721.1 disulfide bond formation protein DsbB [Photobacterium profundum]
MQFLNTFSKSRISWLLLLLCIVFFEGSALFFQHGMKLEPCVMCIYERVAMMGIAFAALLGAIAPQYAIIRWAGLIAWGYSAIRGLQLSIEHVGYQFNPSPFATCDLFVQFPSWAPLNKWVPWMFEAYGDCAKVVWTFLGQSMPQWLVIIFAGNLVALALIVIAQFFSKKTNTIRDM